MPGKIVIAYDGSRDARRAVEAAAILRADSAIVAHVWQPGLAAPAAPVPFDGGTVPARQDDARLERAARAIVDEGCDRARAIGLDAEPALIRGAAPGDIGHALADLAQEHEAAAIVVGRRGISRLEAAVLGSASNATVREARCPVLVVPAPDHD
jgi:nucleotide-binding universal stress UspA family protein